MRWARSVARRLRPKKSALHAAVRRAAHKSGLYERLLAEQGGHCALCPSEPGTRRLHVDHNHNRVGEGDASVRGVLCFRCNALLRTWVTSEWCRRAGAYLERAGE